MAFLAPPPPLPANASLFLDLDGTLAEFVPPERDIDFGEPHRALLREVAGRIGGRLAIISGRALDNLRSTIGIDGLDYAGSHGAERCDRAGNTSAAAPPSDIAALWDEADRFAREHDLFAERKPGGVALHFRSVPDKEGAVERFAGQAATRFGLVVQAGSMVRELRAPGPDKGDAVRAMMAEPLFGAGLPVFVGDDLTDEAGFTASADLGGYGILVGDRMPTAARYRLADVAAVHRWLEGNR